MLTVLPFHTNIQGGDGIRKAAAQARHVELTHVRSVPDVLAGVDSRERLVDPCESAVYVPGSGTAALEDLPLA